MIAKRWTVSGLVVWTLMAAVDAREATAQTCVVPPAGLVGWWPGNATAADAVTGATAQLAGDTTYRTAAVGRGFSFDGVGDYVEIPDAPALKPAQVSVEAWVQFDNLNTPPLSATPGLQFIVFKKNSRTVNFEGYALRKERSGGHRPLRLQRGQEFGFGGWVSSTTAVVVGQLYHVVGSFDGVTVKVYVNGVLEGQAAMPITVDYGTRPVFLGTSGETVYDGKLHGVIDEASIYRRALAAGEVSALYAAGAAGKCAVQLNVPPSILKEPASVNVLPGQATTLTVAATGTAPLSFQWLVGPRGTTTSPIDGATSPAYTTPAVSASTSYWVRVSNPVGTTDSAAAIVLPLPTVGQPVGLYVKALSGNTVTLAWQEGPGQQPVTGHVLEGGLPGSTTPLATVETGSAAPVFVIAVPNGSFWVQCGPGRAVPWGAPSAQMPLCLNAGCPPPPTNVLGLAKGTGT